MMTSEMMAEMRTSRERERQPVGSGGATTVVLGMRAGPERN